MSDEIKEILEILKKCEFGACITKHDSRVLLYYITNLQKENKHLKSELECYENGLYFSSEVDKLQEKINKAIDVLLNYGETFDSKIHQEMQKELLNILQEVK